MPRIHLKINGKEVSRDVAGNALLSDFLRADLNLTGTHIGCDTSQCGVCTVLMNGQGVKACTVFAAEADGSEITTIEAMENEDGSLDPIQAAFQEHHGLQCGFCTPGMVMATADLLRQNKNPSEEEIRTHLEGNICRCTGYHNIVKAVQEAASNIK